MNAAISSPQIPAAAPRLPARHDHVGSFLRPPYLLEARARFAKGEIGAQQLRAIEDRAVAEIANFQQQVGLKSITDGEYRREYFHIDFLDQLGGVQTTLPEITRRADGSEELRPPVIRVIDKVRHTRNIEVDNFLHLQSCLCAGCTAKVAIPSPTMLHFRGGRDGISREAYPELESAFYDDVARAYGDELQALSAAGCSYVQLDDTNLAYLCDPKMREAARVRGDDPDELPQRYANFVNKVVARKPAGMLLAMHLCRGNFKSTFAASGDYEPVAEALLSQMNIDAYFLEYDDARSGDFRPLRHLKKGKIAVLGLITSKTGQLEDKDDIKRRIDEAARHAPLEQLALSPQCGFASSAEGNAISWDDQRRKLELVVQIADEVWGGR
ncbi:MAG TPA: 5-methyltetrahydropteroyltriglutamate--homocysteine S-methyltransferase [Steroidobacteraceae bacterium]|nr:5-methyltetrahydropteroyltriglutamate--homocysteine S-methyltransferase [Steroidobacteraceae bacterium]